MHALPRARIRAKWSNASPRSRTRSETRQRKTDPGTNKKRLAGSTHK